MIHDFGLTFACKAVHHLGVVLIHICQELGNWSTKAMKLGFDQTHPSLNHLFQVIDNLTATIVCIKILQRVVPHNQVPVPALGGHLGVYVKLRIYPTEQLLPEQRSSGLIDLFMQMNGSEGKGSKAHSDPGC